MIPLEHYLLLSAFLLCVGLAIVVTKRNAIVMFIGIELMLNAANINLVAFSRHDPFLLQGQMFTLFVIVIAAAEAAVAMAIVLKIYSFHKTVNVDDIREMKG
ncbi:MAG: NADH-quinone oxidoreductase subunit NuoK [Bacteroidota bacterium]